MSQNPQNNPNYNPYGQNPSNPNYPPGTGYGGALQPPAGSNPGYNPYPSANPPSGQDPNTPHSAYGSYGTPNPYAPPPPPGADNPSNPYDPYAPTAMSQNPISGPSYPNMPSSPGYPNQVSGPAYPSQPSNPGYPAYNPQAGMLGTQTPPPVSAPPPKRGRGATILISVIALIVIVGGLIFAGVAYNNNQQQTLHTNQTATAQANLAATAHANATASAIANTYPFSNKVLLSDPMVDNSKGARWDDDKNNGCFFSGSAYHVVENKANFYNTCAATGSNYSNFTFETQMLIKTGGADAGGGLIFRANENNSQYYRLFIGTDGSYFVLVSVDSTGSGSSGNARQLVLDTASAFNTGLGATNTIAIVARGNTFSFYVNQQLVGHAFTDSTYTSGQVGFDAGGADGKTPTDVVFTNVKVWQL